MTPSPRSLSQSLNETQRCAEAAAWELQTNGKRSAQFAERPIESDSLTAGAGGMITIGGPSS
jgi:hypothetical protein